MIDSGKKIASFVVGVLILAVGIIPMLSEFGLIQISATWLNYVTALAFYIFAAGGLFILIDAHLEGHSLKMISTVIGVLLLAIGLIQLLSGWGLIGFSIPFLTGMFFYVMFIIEGIFLIIAAFSI